GGGVGRLDPVADPVGGRLEGQGQGPHVVIDRRRVLRARRVAGGQSGGGGDRVVRGVRQPLGAPSVGGGELVAAGRARALVRLPIVAHLQAKALHRLVGEVVRRGELARLDGSGHAHAEELGPAEDADGHQRHGDEHFEKRKAAISPTRSHGQIHSFAPSFHWYDRERPMPPVRRPTARTRLFSESALRKTIVSPTGSDDCTSPVGRKTIAPPSQSEHFGKGARPRSSSSLQRISSRSFTVSMPRYSLVRQTSWKTVSSCSMT